MIKKIVSKVTKRVPHVVLLVQVIGTVIDAKQNKLFINRRLLLD